ncbi:MAG: winged helix-turn-helix transcriptional regulator, partial [Bacteroidales bacterium]|nr:winged helix-turn-helix transcriptional regulator [Bacteroidales bacterium]
GTKNKDVTSYRVGSLTFDTPKQTLSLENGEVIRLTTKECELLSLLCSHQNQILERNYALMTIWGENTYFNARSMDVYITKLRKHLKADPNVQIMNIHGKGYKLVVPEQK